MDHEIATKHLNTLLDKIELEVNGFDVEKNPFEAAYALTGLYYAYLKMNNVDVENHAVKNQLSRLRSVHHKIEENKKEINTEVIERVVKHHLNVKKCKK